MSDRPHFATRLSSPSGAFYFRHVIEPYMVYRRIAGINNFDHIIRFDYVDAIADTNEIEFGVANRFFTRRSTENVSAAAVKATKKNQRRNQSPVSRTKRLPSRYAESISSIRILAGR